MISLTEENFDDVVHGNKSLVIEFSASWCAPCQSYQKILELCMVEFPDFVFATVDIDQEAALAEEFQIRSVPATMILRHSSVVCMETGVLTKEALTDLLSQARDLKVDDR